MNVNFFLGRRYARRNFFDKKIIVIDQEEWKWNEKKKKYIFFTHTITILNVFISLSNDMSKWYFEIVQCQSNLVCIARVNMVDYCLPSKYSSVLMASFPFDKCQKTNICTSMSTHANTFIAFFTYKHTRIHITLNVT